MTNEAELNRQPAIDKGLHRGAEQVMARLPLSRQVATCWMHAGAVAQHAVQVGLIPDGLSLQAALERVAGLHPGLSLFGEFPPVDMASIGEFWEQHTLIDDVDLLWWSYPLGDLYQALSEESRKGRALCQTPWWVTDLLIKISYDTAQDDFLDPKVIDPSCGTGHILVEALARAANQHRVYDGYSAVNPYRDYWPSMLSALDRVHGVDLDPWAATVTRYRLIVRAWAQLRHERGNGDLGDLPVHVTAADSLLAEDEPLLEHGQYHVVLANPPYITVKDAETNKAIRARYPEVCKGQYSLALPFHALMMQLLVPDGWCAQLTGNAFMKREYGEKYVNEWMPQFDMPYVIDTSGVYIPGHGTPTLIMVHRNRPPDPDSRAFTVRGKQGEPRIPEDPSRGLVWTAIREAVERHVSAARFVRGAEIAYRLDHPEADEDVPEPPVLVSAAGTPIQGTLFDLLGEGAA